MIPFHSLHLPGSHEDAGFAYGRACAHLLEASAFDHYCASLSTITKTYAEHLPAYAQRWASTLPPHYQAQIHAFAAGARTSPLRVQQWLYADIAAPSPPASQSLASQSALSQSPASHASAPSTLINLAGPMCSGIIASDDAHTPWVARNCDWYEATLARGTAAIVHAVPNRIPILAVGLMGDIDCDTGLNAEGLWLHMHTLLASDEPRAGVSCISWLFWMREALETCATLDDLEAFIARTDRDRGVLLFAVEGKTNQRAIYECTRATFHRVHPWQAQTQAGIKPLLFATNHCQQKHPQPPTHPMPPRISPSNGTVSRYNRLAQLLAIAHPEEGPTDLIELLADPHVEMHTATPGSNLRTIYSAVANPRSRDVWFASGSLPAASTAQWRHVTFPKL